MAIRHWNDIIRCVAVNGMMSVGDAADQQLEAQPKVRGGELDVKWRKEARWIGVHTEEAASYLQDFLELHDQG